jgi:hypothetical protein
MAKVTHALSRSRCIALNLKGRSLSNQSFYVVQSPCRTCDGHGDYAGMTYRNFKGLCIDGYNARASNRGTVQVTLSALFRRAQDCLATSPSVWVLLELYSSPC